MVYCKTSLRNRRSCGSDHHFPSCFGRWLMLLLLEKSSRNQTLQKGFQGQQAAPETSLFICLTDLHPAICHEFRYPHGSRPCQQLRHSCHGRFYSSRKDWFVRLYACTRFRERLLYFHCTKLRSRQKCPHSERYKKCIWNNHSLLPASLTGNLPVCTATDANLHLSWRNGNYPYRYWILEDRRQFLPRYWVFIFMVRILQSRL